MSKVKPMPEITRTTLEQRHRSNRKVLDEHMREFVKVGEALAEVKNTKSYKLVDGYSSFEEWCKVEYQLDRRYVDRIIVAAQERKQLPSPKTGSSGPSFWNERAIRDLRRRVPSPVDRQRIAKKAVAEFDARGKGEKPKATTLVSRFIREAIGPPAPRKKYTPPPPPDLATYLIYWTRSLGKMAEILEAAPDDALQILAREHNFDVYGFVRETERYQKAFQRLESKTDKSVWKTFDEYAPR